MDIPRGRATPQLVHDRTFRQSGISSSNTSLELSFPLDCRRWHHQYGPRRCASAPPTTQNSLGRVVGSTEGKPSAWIPTPNVTF
ncbi:hypothetical protein HUJ04_000021 [Dendroctonus ponderosae]|nr:hypothetical protein HUJ04_000021 [Dendroctonus ponderosae]